jgi:Predicted membrane protein
MEGTAMPDTQTRASKAAKRNISRVAKLEAGYAEKRTATDRIVTDIANWTGSLSFILMHLAWFSFWIVTNTTNLLPLPKFDPYPYILLSVSVSCEAVLLSTIVLIKQNWMSARAEKREQLQLQINLLAEQEVTKLLFLQRLICRRLGIPEADSDPELIDMSRETVVEHLAQELDDHL